MSQVPTVDHILEAPGVARIGTITPPVQTLAESHAIEAPTATGLDTRKLGIWAFIGSEVMFFATLIATYLVYAGRVTSGPTAKEVLDIPLTAINTFVLLTSSLTMVLALAAIRRGSVRRMRIFLSLTVFMGDIFLLGQFYEFNRLFHEGINLGTNLFSASFFTLTGFHGTHVFVGVLWILLVIFRSFGNYFSAKNYMAVEMVGLYWHFVDLVWVVIFTLVYLI